MKKPNWTRLFWSSERTDDLELAELAAEAAERGPAPEPPATVATAAPVDIDFAALYASSTADDPRVDQVLVAFEAMKVALPAAQLAVGIRATAKAIGVPPALVVDTLGKRLAAIDTAVAGARRAASEREMARTAELAAATTKVNAEIDAMERAIAARRDQLAAVTEQLQQQTVEEHGIVAAFDAKARSEAARLVALRDFLGPTDA